MWNLHYRVRPSTINPIMGSLILFILFTCSLQLRAQLVYDSDKYLGNIIRNGNNIPLDFEDYWNQVSPENSGKWGEVEATRNNMKWNSLDHIYTFAKGNDFPYWHHCLIWAQQQPSWIAALDSAEQRAEIEEWITAVGERYPDADFVEVVNEPIEYPPYDYPPSYYEALGGKGETGYDWIITAFEMARKYMPAAKLHINVYGILRGWRDMNTYLKIINLLKDRNLIDGIAVQGHFLETASISTIKTKLNQLAATDLPIYISEYDVDLADDDEQLAKYQEQFPVFWEHPAVKGITLWGYKQGLMWNQSENGYLLRSNGSERPAMEWLREYLEGSSVSVQNSTLPSSCMLYDNYPNPFNPETQIGYRLIEPGKVKIEIFNLLGHKVKTLVDAEFSAGNHSASWNASDIEGNHLPSGVYLYTLHFTGSGQVYQESRKMLLVE